MFALYNLRYSRFIVNKEGNVMKFPVLAKAKKFKKVLVDSKIFLNDNMFIIVAIVDIEKIHSMVDYSIESVDNVINSILNVK